jgi:transposase
MHIEGTNSVRAEEVEVLAKPKRRKFNLEKKLQVLREADRCKAPGELGALLRREGLYWSTLSRWRVARERGELSRAGAKKRGPAGRERDERDDRIRELERENRRLRARAERAEALIEVQKKVSEILGIELAERAEESEKD